MEGNKNNRAGPWMVMLLIISIVSLITLFAAATLAPTSLMALGLDAATVASLNELVGPVGLTLSLFGGTFAAIMVMRADNKDNTNLYLIGLTVAFLAAAGVLTFGTVAFPLVAILSVLTTTFYVIRSAWSSLRARANAAVFPKGMLLDAFLGINRAFDNTAKFATNLLSRSVTAHGLTGTAQISTA